MSLHKRVADQWLRKQAAPAMLRVILQELETLQELSENLTDIEDQVYQTFKAAKKLDPEVKSQFAALKKAREGLRQARSVGEAVATILQQYPEDKTAQRAAKDAAVMIKRFQKHSDDARKIISRLSKKAMPPALKKMSASLARMLKTRLVDPKLLTMKAWIGTDYDQGREGVMYTNMFRVDGKDTVALGESTIRSGVYGVNTSANNSYLTEPTTAKKQVEMFLAKMRGSALIKGGEQKNKDRAAVAADLYSEIWSEWRSLYSGDGPSRDMASNGLSMEFESRPLPRQDHGGGDDGDDWMDGSEVSRLTRAEQASTEGAVGSILKKYKPYIKSYSTDYGEKGHWTLYIYLK